MVRRAAVTIDPSKGTSRSEQFPSHVRRAGDGRFPMGQDHASRADAGRGEDGPISFIRGSWGRRGGYPVNVRYRAALQLLYVESALPSSLCRVQWRGQQCLVWPPFSLADGRLHRVWSAF